MKFSKGQGMSLFTAFLIFGIFNVVVFLAPLAHTVVFWLGYAFAVFALVTMTLVLTLYFGKPVKEDKFLNLPAVKVAWTYFILQSALSVWEMVACPFSYLPALTINLVVGAIFAIVILALYASAERIDKSEQFTAEKVIFIKQLKLKLDSIETNDVNLEKKIKNLAEDVRFSDQMSHSKLAEIEAELENAIDELVENAANAETAQLLCEKAAKLLKKRNDQCKMYKGVKDPLAAAAKKSDKGLGLAFAGACAMLTMFLIALVICFIVVPQNKYNTAVSLKNDGRYEDAIAVFETLGNYKDSKDQIEHISNMTETENVIHFGMYKGESISWTILRVETDKMLLIAESPVDTLSYNDTLQNVTWETSDIREWLNDDFLKEFSKEQKGRILPSESLDIDDGIFLLSKDEYEQYSDVAKNTSIADWWTRTKTAGGMIYVNGQTGELETSGRGVIYALGVRPCVWVTLK